MNKKFSIATQVCYVLFVAILLSGCNVAIPNLIGMHQADAHKTLENAGLSMGHITSTEDGAISKDHVITQNPEAGVKVKKGTPVDLLVSLGKKALPMVPDVINQNLEDARNAIESAGLVVGRVTGACSDTIAPDIIISTTPAANTPVTLGTPITLVVSTGLCQPNGIIVPNLIGQSQSVAETQLSALGLKMGVIDKAYSATVSLGLIIEQFPSPGTNASPGSTVDLVISLGLPLEDGVTTFKPVTDTEDVEIEPGVAVQAASGEIMLSLKFDITKAELESVLHFIEEQSFEVVGHSSMSRVLQIRRTAKDIKLDAGLFDNFKANEYITHAGPNMMVELQRFDVMYEVPYNNIGIIGDNTKGYLSSRKRDPYEIPDYLFDAAEKETKEWQPEEFDGDWWISAIEAPEAWVVSTGSPEVSMGIIERDIAAHNTIDENRLTILYADGDNGDGRSFWLDPNTGMRTDHGERVTGLAAGDGSDPYAVGVAWKNPVTLVRWGWREEGLNVQADIGSAIELCIRYNAKAINLSLGPALNPNILGTEEAFLAIYRWFREGLSPFVRTAAENDSLTVWASGNDGFAISAGRYPRLVRSDGTIIAEATRTDGPESEYNYILGTTVRNDDQLFPDGSKQIESFWLTNALIVGAAAPSVLDSTASLFAEMYIPTDNEHEYLCHDTYTQGKIAQFSRLGKVVNIMAPGVDVSHNPDFSPSSGTSFAAPLVTGGAVLLKSINQNLSMTEVRRMLLDGANGNPFSGTGAKVGSGLVDLGRSADFARSSLTVPIHPMIVSTLNYGETDSFMIDVFVPESGVNALDVVICTDVSGSYEDDIENLKRLATDIVSELANRIPDVYFGLTSFSDFPASPFGDQNSGDEAFYLNLPLTGSKEKFFEAVNGLRIFFGADDPESQLEALYQMATGAGRDVNGNGDFTEVGDILPSNVGWRPGALRVIILATDAGFHNSDSDSSYPGSGFSDTVTSLRENNITVLGLYTDIYAEWDLGNLVNELGRGSIHPLAGDSSNIVEAVTGAFDTAISSVDVTIEVLNDHNAFVQNPELLKRSGVTPGETIDFEINLKGTLNEGVSGHEPNFDIIAWALVNDSGLIKRIPIRVTVPKE